MRKFKGKKVDYMCEICYPNKVSCKKFADNIIKHLPAFVTNMTSLNIKDDKYPENWMEIFLNWYEINTENDRYNFDK